jgi:hypothetical protein
MTLADRIQTYLQRLTPLMRGNLLAELERLEQCGDEIPGVAEVMGKLRAELRKDGSSQNRVSSPSRVFFAPLEPLLIDGAPEHANSGRMSRGSLPPIWEWISRDLLPTMTRDYVGAMAKLIAADNQREARLLVATFQTKVVKSLENTLGSPDSVEQARAKLATYTASPAVYGDLTKILRALRAREALAKFDEALPATLDRFDDAKLSKVTALLDGFRKANAEELAFALTLVAKRLKAPWQLIGLAIKAATGKNAADVAATPYAVAVSMVLDRLDDKRLALRIALKKNRILVAKEILAEIYDTEHALQTRIDLLDESDWGERLRHLMTAIATLVEAEVSRFPADLRHVLGTRSLRGNGALTARLAHLASQARGSMSRLFSPPKKSRA